MKNIIISLKIIIVFLLIFTTSCSKYEEGPFFSLQTKKERLVKTWELTEIIDNGGTWNNFSPVTLLFNEDGTGARDYLATESSIEWKFDKNKENLLIKENSSEDYISYEIIKLTKEELWLQRYWADELGIEKYSAKY